MTRYNQNYSGSTGGSSGSSSDFEDITLKVQKYSAIEVTGQRVNAFNSQYGDTLVVGFEDVEVIDGIVFQRDDRPGTWKVVSPGKFFDVDPETGLVTNPDGNEMSAADVLAHPRVVGFNETFGGNDYFYTPVGVALEAAGDIATNTDLDVETNGNKLIIGEVSMLLSNKSWVRTLGKLLTAEGDDLIVTETDEEGNERSVTESSGWLSTLDPTLREGIEGRRMELFVIEETAEFGDGEVTYSVPILLDHKTGNRITIDNYGEDDGEAEEETEAEPATAATDGGVAAAQPVEVDKADEADETPAESADEGDLPADVPEVLDQLIDYFARTDGTVTPEELRDFAADEVEDSEAVDWEAAAAEVERRA